MEPLVEGAQQALAEQLRAVHRLTFALHAPAPVQAFYDQVLETIVDTLEVDRASLLLFDPDGVLRFKAWRGLSDEYRATVEGYSPWAKGQAEAVPILVPDVEADPDLAELLPVLRDERIAAVAFLPLLTGDGVIGKFMLYYDRPYPFPAHQVALAEILAGHVGLATERQQAHRRSDEAAAAARASAARLGSLQTITAALSRAVDTAAVAEVALGVALRELGARSGSLCLLEGDQLRIAAAAGYPDQVRAHWDRFPLGADLPAAEVVRTARPVFVRNRAELVARYPAFAGTPVVGDEAYAMVPIGEEIPLGALVAGYPEPRRFETEERAFLAALAAQCAAAFGRAALYEQREAARLAAEAERAAAEASRARLAFLAEASAVLGSSLDYPVTLARVAELAVPRLGDMCAIYLPEGNRAQLAGLAHIDPAVAALARATITANPAHLSDAHGVGAVLRTGVTEVYLPMTADALAGIARSPAHLEMLHRLEMRAAVMIALTARGRTIGALAMGTTGERDLDEESIALAEQLAGRAGAAIDNALLYSQRSAAVRTLQASLLPPALPVIPGLDLGARYLAGGAGLDVGGDFYDVFPLYGDRHVVVLGDVCGRGVEAAQTALLIRHVIRSAALSLRSPAAILTHLNEVMTGHAAPPAAAEDSSGGIRFATAVLAVVHPRPEGTVALSLALAGHPLPLLRRADGTVHPVGRAGTLLGVAPDPDLSDQEVRLEPGDAWVAFTDGVSERRNGPAFFGEDGLTRQLATTRAQTADALAGEIQAAVATFAPGDLSDDLAVLIVRAPAHPLPLEP